MSSHKIILSSIFRLVGYNKSIGIIAGEAKMFFGEKSIFKKNSDLSLVSGMRRVVLGVILVVLASFLFSTYLIADNERKNGARNESERIIRILSNTIVYDYEKYKSISRLILKDPQLMSFLRADADSVNIGMINDARYSVMDILNVTEGVDSVMIFREDLIMFSTNRFTYEYDTEKMEGEEWRKDIYEELGKPVVSFNSNGVATKINNKQLITIGRAIYDIDTQKRIGIMMMNILPQVLDNMITARDSGNICIMGTDGSYLAGNGEYAQFYGEEFKSNEITHKYVRLNGKNFILSGMCIEDLPIVILRASEYGLKGMPTKVIYVLIFLLATITVMEIFIGLFVRRQMTDPISELSSAIDENRRSGKLKKIDVPVPNAELSTLENDYNRMIDHVYELMDKLMEREKTLQRAEMRVLQEQIKPHFLYNSIATIGYMALDSGATKVHEALETLGEFYRNFLSKGEREIPLSKEITIVRDYLAIQKLRYGDILEDEYDIADDTKDLVIPKLILQPIVENCIYHGIRPKGEKGIIKVTSKMSDGKLVLSVRDTGVGMPEEQIERILLTEGKEGGENESESFGLWGTIERVRYYTGEKDVVQIKSEIGEYTEITFFISKL